MKGNRSDNGVVRKLKQYVFACNRNTYSVRARQFFYVYVCVRVRACLCACVYQHVSMYVRMCARCILLDNK